MPTLTLPPHVVNRYKELFMRSIAIIFERDETTPTIERLYKCNDCNDSGEVANYYSDSDSHMTYQDGTRPCHCQL